MDERPYPAKKDAKASRLHARTRSSNHKLDSGIFCCLTSVDTESVVRQAGNRSVVPPPDRPPPRRCARVRSDEEHSVILTAQRKPFYNREKHNPSPIAKDFRWAQHRLSRYPRSAQATSGRDCVTTSTL